MARPRKNVEEVEVNDVVAKVEEADVVDVSHEDEEVVEEKDEKINEVSVFDSKLNLIRIYSKKVHGKDFKKLAEQFISDRPGHSLK